MCRFRYIGILAPLLAVFALACDDGETGDMDNGAQGEDSREIASSAKALSSGVERGDVDGDGSITIVDALGIAKYLQGDPASIFHADAADVNCDGTIELVDANLVGAAATGQFDGFSCGILSFEDPSLWSASAGSIASSGDANSGPGALAVAGVGYAVLTSDPVLNDVVVSNNMSLDIKLPADHPNPYWMGQVQAVLECPSQGVYSHYLPAVNLQGLPLDTYQTLDFDVPSDIVDALSDGCFELRIKIVLNVPQGSVQPYLLDNLRFTDVWPNEVSNTNGDQWLRDHHDFLSKLRPKVLVIHANKTRTLEETKQMANETAAMIQEASRYHGYNDTQAQPQISYQLDYVDITVGDSASTEWPAIWPVVSNRINYAGLFTTDFADAMGIEDPNDPSHNLTMCELFERGIVNEVWAQAPRPVGIFESKSRAQNYDLNLEPIPGSFNLAAGNGSMYVGTDGQCGVTVRFLELLSTRDRGVGCTMEAVGHGFEGLADRNLVPYLKENSERFFNFNLNGRLGLPYYSQYNGMYCPYDDHTATTPRFGGVEACYAYPAADTISPGNFVPHAPSTDFRMPYIFSDWGDGCGNVHFMPGGVEHYDTTGTNGVLTTCENYGLRNGPDGEDLQTPFDTNSGALWSYKSKYWDCMGGWMIYMFQSMPGLGSEAVDVNGDHMKAWLPFMFY